MPDAPATHRPAADQPTGHRATAPAPRWGGPLPWVLTLAVLALTLLLVLRSIGALLAQVQLTSGNSYGGMESVGGGLTTDFVARTQALLEVWREAAAGSAGTRTLIARTAVTYTYLDMVFLVVYAALVVLVWRWLRALPGCQQRRDTSGPNRLRHWAWWPRWWLLPLVLAACDAVENLVRLVIVLRTVDGAAVPGWLIWASWVPTTLKLLLFAICVVLLLVLLLDSGIPGTWWRGVGWALWRLRVAVLATVLYVAVLLVDPTGQAIDLARRWLNDPVNAVAGVLALLAAGLLGFATWLTARRVVLADQTSRAAGDVPWRRVLLAAAAVTAVAAWLSGWRSLGAVTVVAVAILLLGLLWNARPMTVGRDQQATMAEAARSRARDARAPRDQRLSSARLVARTLAVAAPVALLVLTAVAYAPVPLVLSLSGADRAGRWVPALLLAVAGAVGAPAVALGGWLLLRAWDGDSERRPAGLERKYLVGCVLITLATAGTFLGAFTRQPLVTAFVVVPMYLAAVMLLLGEAQRWSETHTAPPGLLAVGLTRVPVAALLVLVFVLASYRFSDGSAHAVHRAPDLPAGLVGADGLRSGVSLDAAFQEWVAGNCAAAQPSGGPAQVPLILVAAPGGGLRAAYWTGSALSDLFGAARAPAAPGCAAAPSDRIFAVGGASGGSLGALAYVSGLDPGPAGPRAGRWYDEELARPDFLTDPLAWLLSADAFRVYLGYGGEDRARRLEMAWSAHIGGLDGDFLTGAWGQGGHRPILMVTGTHVETGCRLNVGGLRLTDPGQRRDEGSCATLRGGPAQADAPVTSDLLDYLCGPEKGSRPGSVSYATAALLSARFPYVSPSGQLYRCSEAPADGSGEPTAATRTAVVDGGYADNTGLGLLLALWPRLERLIAAHNAVPGSATIVPVLLEVDNHYAQVAAPTEPGRTVEMLVPPSTKSRPDKLDDRAMEGQAAGIFTGPLPGTARRCDVDASTGRFVRIGPRTSPGLPAPLAWTLSRLATEDLTAQREVAVDEAPAARLSSWARGAVACA
ncbi:hypothetical protein [Actinoplanes sp. NPDC049599]|uniref:hypothetical protein n=1 Tax=Actinoplanes sp. NPDC049599 TaxID=3363903 RepID=UPI0037BCDF09